MFKYAKNELIQIDNFKMDYITFGKGVEPLVIIPGLGDGITTVKGKALFFCNQLSRLWKEIQGLYF